MLLQRVSGLIVHQMKGMVRVGQINSAMILGCICLSGFSKISPVKVKLDIDIEIVMS